MQSQSLRQRCRPPTPSPPITCITTAGLSNSPPCSLDGCICATESRHISVLRLVFALGVFMETLWQDENTNPRLGSTKQKKKEKKKLTKYCEDQDSGRPDVETPGQPRFDRYVIPVSCRGGEDRQRCHLHSSFRYNDDNSDRKALTTC